MKRCQCCFSENLLKEKYCKCCGKNLNEEPKEVYHLKPGTILKEKYYIGEVVGYGGFGVVYKAYDLILNQIIAIKEYYPTMYLVRNEGSNEVHIFDSKNESVFMRGKEGFLTEARNIAKYIKHPNIVHIFDYFEENKTAYFVMEYLEGFTLRECNQIAQKNGLVVDVNSAVKIAVKILDVLAVVHKDGIIHRDIKPANICILKDGTIKLFDFGAAKFFDDDNDKTRSIIFTPGYAPPEQYEIKSKQGPYTDIYAVGAILYEMITGVRLEESINRKVVDEVIRPEKINLTVPEYLSNAVMRSLAIFPDIRFKTADEFRDILVFSQVIRSDKQEIKRRKRRRNIRVLFIVMLILGISGFAGKMYFDRYVQSNLIASTVTIWLPTEEGMIDENLDMYNNALNEFYVAHPNVSVNFVVINENEYEEKLYAALQNGNGPDIFESSSLSENSIQYMANMSPLISECSIVTSDYYGLDIYDELFPDYKRFPITFDSEILYLNSLVDIDEVTQDYELFKNETANYLGSVTEYDKIVNDMAGKFDVKDPGEEYKNIYFNHLWSINAGIDQYQQIIARRIIGFMLSNNAQEEFSVYQNIGMPLNKSVMNEYIEIYSDFEFVTQYAESGEWEE